MPLKAVRQMLTDTVGRVVVVQEQLEKTGS
jgi:hypothetical protein